MTDNRGFTLVELISVVLILSVLALIVYPSYRNYVEKAKINAVRAALLENAHFMEKFYLQNGRFKQTSTKWPSLPIKEAEGFCIRLNGIARGALDSKFMLKAVAIDKDKNPFIIKMNENLVTFICKKSASSCSDRLDYFKGNDKDCKLLK
ncbi:type IV pilin protein [Neisseria gonorrhoeae]